VLEYYVQHVERLMKDSWEAEISVERREAMDPLAINLGHISKRKNGSDD
jgi:hypothetical protein